MPFSLVHFQTVLLLEVCSHQIKTIYYRSPLFKTFGGVRYDAWAAKD